MRFAFAIIAVIFSVAFALTIVGLGTICLVEILWKAALRVLEDIRGGE